MNRTSFRNAFTLIELLITISIIGILAGILFVSIGQGPLQKARDAKRVSDVRQIQTALELFYEKNGYYPQSGNCAATVPNGGWCNSVESLSGGFWIRNGSTNLGEFLPADPVDPVNANNWLRGAYYYFARGYGSNAPFSQWYMLVYSLERFPNAILEGQDGVRAPDGTFFHYGSGSNGIITVGVNKQN